MAEVRRHPAILARPATVALGAILVASVVGFLLSPGRGTDPIDTAAGVVALAALIRLAWKVWEWWLDRLYLTDQRVFEVSGILTRSVTSMPLEKVTDMTYRRSIMGRLLGYGELRVESAGQDQALTRVTYLPSPDELYRTLNSLMAQAVYAHAEAARRELFFHGTDDEDTGPLPRVTL